MAELPKSPPPRFEARGLPTPVAVLFVIVVALAFLATVAAIGFAFGGGFG